MGPFATQMQQPEKFERALDFLEQVKLQFQNQPQVYNQFLEIMKDFKTKVIDTPGVIGRVSELFVGNPHLIKGFNNFLPPGHKIDASASDDGGSELRAEREQVSPLHKQQALTPPMLGHHMSPGMMPMNSSAPPRTQEELVHAREYVNKIKIRFADRPEIYKAFLQILSDFKKKTDKECTSNDINDVYSQVANLFQNESDLLGEFTQFLPPAATVVVPESLPPMARKQKPGRKAKRNKRLDERQKKSEQHQEDEDFEVFMSIRHMLKNDSLYKEFLKCLELLNTGIISQEELMRLLADLFEYCPSAYEEFKDFTGFKDAPLVMQKEEIPIAWNEIDFGACRRCGPSYRELPPEYRTLECSGRTPACKAVLNDVWVSVPTGSEDGGSFKASRKNQYEEVLFKCEDDRYELDMLIHQNLSAIQSLQMVMEEIHKLSDAEVPRYRLPDACITTLNARSIERVYGEKSGKDIIEGLRNNPIVAVPVVLRRLHQKDFEWRKARKEWNKIWNEVVQKNHHKSLDHQSANFKQNEKKSLSTKALVAEIKQKYQSKLKSKSPLGYHLKYHLKDESIVQDVLDLLTKEGLKSTSEAEQANVREFLVNVVGRVLAGQLPLSSNATSAPAEVTGMNVEGVDVAASSSEAPTANGSLEDGASAAPSSLVMFGNNTLYAFFRLLQILYDRLDTAKILSERAATSSKPTKMRMLIETGRKGGKPDFPKFENGAELYEHYRTTLLAAFLDGHIDQSTYEDTSRELFGVNSYVLFTVDKVVSQLHKQLMNVLSCDACVKLVALFIGQTSHADADRVAYQQAALSILQEERMFKMEFVKSDNGKMAIELLDAVNQPRFVELSVGKEQWNQYVSEYTAPAKPDPPPPRVEPQSKPLTHARQVFLARTQRPLVGSSSAMRNVIASNQLQCKICISTYRLFYVEDTEDCFYRSGSLSAGKRNAHSAARLERFKRWANVESS